MSWSLIDLAWLIFAAFGCGYAALLALSLLLGPARSSQTTLFIALFWFTIGLWMFITAFAALGILDRYAYFRFVQIPPAYVAGPALWLHFRAYAEPVSRKTIGLHFLPAFIAFVFVLPLYFAAPEYKHDLDRRVHDLNWAEFMAPAGKAYAPWIYDRIAHFVLTLPKVSFVVYLSVLIVRRFYGTTERRATRILKWTLGSWMAAMLTALINQFEQFDGSYQVALTIAIIGAVFLFLIRHSYAPIHSMIEGGTARGKSKLIGLDTASVLRRLDALMTADRLYLEPGLSLGEVSERLGVSQHQLSELLNQVRKKSFLNYVNEYRIVDARKLLAAKEPQNILQIALEVGFNSKATFNRAFRRQVGVTPREYRTQQSRSATGK